MDYVVHGVTESQTRLSDFSFRLMIDLLVFPTFFYLSLSFAIKSL